MDVYGLFFLLTGTNFQYVNLLSLNNYVAINTMSTFISIQNNNKWITTNHDTQPENNEKDNVSVPIHQVQITNKSEYQKQKFK